MNMLAAPALIPFANLIVHVGPPIELGEKERCLRRNIPIVGGEVEGLAVRGVAGVPDTEAWRAGVQPGVDEQRIGLMPEPTWAKLKASYALAIDGADARIKVVNHAKRIASAEDTARLMRGEPVDPSRVYFRGVLALSTRYEPLEWIRNRVFVCVGERMPQAVRMTWFLVA
jgi:hypothetical protein